ncbi:MAG: 4-hydroxy-tetrahydrodipicolinate reductase [Patescibacteria group bacterium]
MRLERIRVAVVGAAGRMGREVIKAVSGQEDMVLVAAVDLAAEGEDAGTVAGLAPLGVAVERDLPAALARTGAQVMVDFTAPAAVRGHIDAALNAGVAAVVGTTGLTAEAYEEITALAAARDGRLIIAPNFALGAVLMMHFAAVAARYFPRAEIIELHHDAKLDAPSGTAVKTAETILGIRGEGAPERKGAETVAGARGAVLEGLHLHSVRLPGLVAHQEVLFGFEGQLLTIRHDSFARSSFMPGVLLAIREVRQRPGVTYGLEKLLDL